MSSVLCIVTIDNHNYVSEYTSVGVNSDFYSGFSILTRCKVKRVLKLNSKIKIYICINIRPNCILMKKIYNIKSNTWMGLCNGQYIKVTR